MTVTSPGVTILYGTETGNSQDYAQCLAKKLKFLQLNTTLQNLNEFPLKNLVTETEYLVIVCSTTGQGELPRNAKRFMKFLLKKKLPNDLLSHIKLTTLGLGDSSYPKFNYGIRKIHTRLLQLGCAEFCPRCEADEQSPEGVDKFYQEWESNVVEALRKEIPNLKELEEGTLLPAEYPIEILRDSPDLNTIEIGSEVSLSRANNFPGIVKGKLKSNKRVTAKDHFQDVRHIIIESEELKYNPGDTVALYPQNDPQSVELLIKLQPHWVPIADKPLRIHGNYPVIEGGLIGDKYMTLRSLFTFHIDLMSIPRRSFFMTLWHFSDPSTDDGAREQERLKEFSNIDEAEELYDYANRPRRLILEVILEFQENLKIPIEYILDLFPTIKPRLFLIASRPSKTQVELLVAIVEYKTVIRRIRRGLCTKWLKLLNENDDILFNIHKAGMNFKVNDEKPPIIMIAPGTGIAPMKSLIEHVSQLDSKQDLYLFYGCRYKEKDYIFGDRWNELCSEKKLHIFTCFSRDKDSKIKYVQHAVYEQLNLIGDLLCNKQAIVYLCGSSGNMPREVRSTLQDIISKFAALSEEGANRYLLEMENNGRYIQETW